MKTKCTIKSFWRGLRKLPEWVTQGHGWDIGCWREPFGEAVLCFGGALILYFAFIAYMFFDAHPLWDAIATTVLMWSVVYYIIRITIAKCCELGK